jgi:hypothetical protein
VGLLRSIYRYVAALLFVAVIVQVGAAGYGAFYAAHKLANTGDTLGHTGFDHGFNFHDGFGYLIFVVAVVLFLLAVAGRVGKPGVLWALAAPLLLLVQILLARAGESAPAIGPLHAINALLVVGLTGGLAHRAWRRASAP